MNKSIRIALLSFNHCIAAMLLAAIAFSCRTAEVSVHNDLKTGAEVYTVKGRQGFQVGQVLSFGDFKTSKVNRGWTFGYSIPFIVSFQGASEKLSFRQLDQHGGQAEVVLVSKFRETELAVAKDYFSVSLHYKNYFAGAIKLDHAESSWDFIVYNADGAGRGFGNRETSGFVRNGRTRIDIRAINSLEGSSEILTYNSVYGYEFTQGGKVIAAVSTINNGKVWMKEGLDAETRLVLAGICSGLMLRNQVEDQALSLQ
ncbi:hypothetical protein [Dyadobacter sandarakinus]|uniref:Lipoprotein n=1 Tax=Dyadobacter sandarakinus TaxID=2747268 RepID=A0ABX7IC27_9BACT|nr:hypothetical protein [Dyadobacter sandarakinus]QRR03545.1 hypothetical protein HWI92_22830 [Dyadobacter sandarakinus]